MQAAVTKELRITDVTGQKAVKASAVPSRLAIGEFVQSLIAKMGLARNDVDGRPLRYQARLDREGRHLRGSEKVGDVLRDGDEVTLTPDIDAG